jgi:hypothetical protein
MATTILFEDGIAVIQETVFTPKPQSPTAHLKALRHPNPKFSNTTPYLSPGLHNGSDTWVRYLRSKAHQFIDENGDGKNQRLLMGMSVQDRKQINEWCNTLKDRAKEFIMTTHDDAVAAREEEYLARQNELFAAINLSSDHDEDEQCNNSAYDWSEYLDDPEEQVPGAVEDWSEDFDLPDEDIEFAAEKQADGNEFPGDNPRSTSSCSSLSTEYDPIFDGDENHSDDEVITNYSYNGAFMQANECEGAVQVLCDICATTAEVSHPPYEIQVTSPESSSKKDLEKKERKRQRRLARAERRLSSGWRHWERDGARLTQCSWVPIKSQFRPETVKEIASASPVPFIQLTTPEGEVCDLIERQPVLRVDFDEYVYEREAAQDALAKRVKKYRDRYETYSQYCKRLNQEEWLREREKETAIEMAEEESILANFLH